MIKFESIEIVEANTWQDILKFNCWGNIKTFPDWNINLYPIFPVSTEVTIKIKVSEATWDSIKSDFSTWQDINNNNSNWNEIKNYISK